MKPEGLAVIGIGLIVILIGLVSPLSTMSVVGASLSVSPSSGPAGTAVSATPSGFIGSVSITFNGASVCSTNSGYACNFAAPNLAAGTYSVGASDSNGNTASSSFTITTVVQTTTTTSVPPPIVTTTSTPPPPPPLFISGSATPVSGTVPLTVGFSVTASGGSPPYSYLWSFGDGGTSNSASASHIYPTAGSYAASITVTDAAGARQSSSFTITASNPVVVTTTSTTSSQTVITTTNTAVVTTTNAQGQAVTTTSTSVATITTSAAVPVLVTTTQSQTQGGVAKFSTQSATPNALVLAVGMVVVGAGAFLTRRGRR